MICCFSFKSSSSSSSSSFKNIRVVHLNGCLEEFENPLAVSEVTGKPAKHFVFTYAQLVSAGSDHLKPDTILEPGHVYFLLPYSTFQSEISPVDLVPIARKLAAIAKDCHPKSRGKSGGKKSSLEKTSSPARSPNRFSPSGREVHTLADAQKPSRRSWKPVLATIRELSFNKRSESDLHERSMDKRNSLDAC